MYIGYNDSQCYLSEVSRIFMIKILKTTSRRQNLTPILRLTNYENINNSICACFNKILVVFSKALKAF